MKERPILFSAPMVRALLDGSKTQTRRVVKTQPEFVLEPSDYKLAVGGRMVSGPRSEWLHWNGSRIAELNDPRCPYGQPGDRLWVREAWSTHSFMDGVKPSELKTRSFHYWADGEITTGKRRPSIHMPRFASRITLEIVSVRVERLRDISEADAWAEGCARGDADDAGGFFPAEEPDPSGIGSRGWDNARDWYADLWETINGPDSWDKNPWAWAVEFKRIEP
jgi:hypothetical protein